MRQNPTFFSVSSRVVMTQQTFLIEKMPLSRPQYLLLLQKLTKLLEKLFCHLHFLLTCLCVLGKFFKTSKFQKNKKFCPISPTYYSPSCTTIRSPQNVGNAVKHTQVVAYDTSISVIVMQCFWRKWKVKYLCLFFMKRFFAEEM